MEFKKQKTIFDETASVFGSAILSFSGVDGFDVYNCSIPFEKDGKTYLFGRVERRTEWANSHVALFVKTAEDVYAKVPDMMIYPLEDPFVQFIDGEIILGGTHVRKTCGKIDTYYAYFYRGRDIRHLTYFTTGPEYMKDIRLIKLPNGRIGVFSRPRSEEIKQKYRSESVVGFMTIASLDELEAKPIAEAKIVPGLFDEDEWGGCNQCYLLEDGRIGVLGHKGYPVLTDAGLRLQVYTNISFVFDPATHIASDIKIVGTRKFYPAAEPKIPELSDCVFTSGIVNRPDGKVDLYSGVSDTSQGRIVIDKPF